MYFRKIEPILFIVLFFSFLLILWNAFNYGFWRHDAWGYSTSEVEEFRNNGRWLAMIFFEYLRYVPHFMAWLLSVFGVYYYFYSLANRFLAKEGVSKWIIASLPFIVLVNPGFIGQLGWPIHTLSAIMILSIGAYYTSQRDSILVMMLTTVLVFSVLQSLSFLALLLAIPAFYRLGSQGGQYIFKYFFKIILAWAGAILFGYVFSKLLQYLVWGEIPSLPAWRRPNPVESFSDLMNNAQHSLEAFLNHLLLTYPNFEFIFILLLVISICFFFLLVKKQKTKIIYLLGVVTFSVLLMTSVYWVTIPVGTVISFRSTIIISAGIFLIAVVVIAFTKSIFTSKYFLILSFLIVFISFYNPYVLALKNSKYFREITTDIKGTFNELSDYKLRSVNKVYISVETSNIWGLSYTAALHGKSQVIEGFNDPYSMNRAFNELGFFGAIHWCSKDAMGNYSSPECKVLEGKSFSKCSLINPNYCASTLDSNRNWFLRVK